MIIDIATSFTLYPLSESHWCGRLSRRKPRLRCPCPCTESQGESQHDSLNVSQGPLAPQTQALQRSPAGRPPLRLRAQEDRTDGLGGKGSGDEIGCFVFIWVELFVLSIEGTSDGCSTPRSHRIAQPDAPGEKGTSQAQAHHSFEQVLFIGQAS